MSENKLPLPSFAIGGYRSFGDKVQRFGRLSRINLFIGQNNSGKSNVLRFIHEVYSVLAHENKGLKLTTLDRHVPTNANFVLGCSISLTKNEQGNYEDFLDEISKKISKDNYHLQYVSLILDAFKNKALLDETGEYVWFDFDLNKTLINNNWLDAFKVINDRSIQSIWGSMTGQSGGSRNENWLPEVIRRVTPRLNLITVQMIPAIRQIGKHGSVSDEFSGEGIIERLAKLQNPDIANQKDKGKFQKINKFLQNVIDNKSVSIEIPHARDTIHVNMNGKTLPLELLGTGIHEVVILAAAATILENTVICMEEPELHLNPILQKKLVRYLLDATNNQYFISTHSAALMDTPSAEIYHIKIENGQSVAEHATSDKQRSEICEDLGYHPSDLLQSNCMIWVEGPSDRIYIKKWVNVLAPQFIEGIHYSIMFYGGRLASHLTGDDIDKSIDNFISLRRLNRRGIIVIDSDKNSKSERINETKKRLQEEFDSGPGFAWITQGREMENYLNAEAIKTAILSIHPKAKFDTTFGQYEHMLAISTKTGKVAKNPSNPPQVSKVDIAKFIVENSIIDFNILDLKMQTERLVEFIDVSNQSVVIAKN